MCITSLISNCSRLIIFAIFIVSIVVLLMVTNIGISSHSKVIIHTGNEEKETGTIR